MPHSQRDRSERELEKLVDHVRIHYDSVGQLLNSNKINVRTQCCEYGVEFTPSEVDDCFTILSIVYQMVTNERNYYND
jgi:hypothetical protein